MSWSDDELTAHGVALVDEGYHPVAPGDVSWNESIFFDWIDEGGERAGHCRIGRLPGQDRLWVWLYVLDGGQWHGFDVPDLSLDHMSPDCWSYQSERLHFAWTVERPLETSRLRLSCDVAKVGDDPMSGAVPLSLDLVFRAAGPAHGMAARKVRGTDGQTYLAGRFEQPCNVSGTLSLAGQDSPICGRGERDHSWGPRYWAIQWMFLVLAGERLRAQCTEVLIGGKMRICVGYLQAERMETLKDVTFDLTFDETQTVLSPYTGTVSASSETLSIEGTIEPVTGVQLDDGHCLPKGQASLYTRHLVRFTPSAGGEPTLGWLEVHRLRKPTA